MQNIQYKYTKTEYAKFEYSLCNQRISIYQHQLQIDDIGDASYIIHKLLYETWGYIAMPYQCSAFNKKYKLDKYQIITRYREDLHNTDQNIGIKWKNHYIKIEACDNILLQNRWLAIYGISVYIYS